MACHRGKKLDILVYLNESWAIYNEIHIFSFFVQRIGKILEKIGEMDNMV